MKVAPHLAAKPMIAEQYWRLALNNNRGWQAGTFNLLSRNSNRCGDNSRAHFLCLWKALKFVGMLVLLLCANLHSARADAVDVLTSRNDVERTGANLHETILNVANVNSSFGKLGFYDLNVDGEEGGYVYAQPLYASKVVFPNHDVKNILLVATTNNFVFAFDADANEKSSDASSLLWHVKLGTPPSIQDVWTLGRCEQDDRHCAIRSTDIVLAPPDTGNMVRNVGIVSTPVIDRNTNSVFVVSRLLAENPKRIVYRVHALELSTGREMAGSPFKIENGIVLPTGVSFNPAVQNQRPGLAMSRGNVIVAFGAHEDLLPYRGWVMSFRYDALPTPGFVRTGAFVTTPGGTTARTCAPLLPAIFQLGNPIFNFYANECAHGGIWMSGRAPAVDSEGNILLQIGNGKNDMSPTTRRNFGNSLVKLDPLGLNVLDFYTPQNHIYLNDADLDFGGSGPMVVPGSNLIVGGGKEGFMHVWRGSDLGQFRLGDPGALQRFPTGIAKGYHDRSVDHPGGPAIPFIDNNTPHPGHIMAGPVYWPRPQQNGGPRLYNWSEDSELRAYAVDTTSAFPIALPHIAAGSFIQNGHPGGILSLSANGGDAGTGIVWANTYDAGDYNILLGKTPGALVDIKSGTLRAYDAETLEEIWDSYRVLVGTGPHGRHPRDALGAFAKFTPPTISNGRVYMATFSNRIVVYGLLNHNYNDAQASALTGITHFLLESDDEVHRGKNSIPSLMDFILNTDGSNP
jgi:hypothetical protein